MLYCVTYFIVSTPSWTAGSNFTQLSLILAININIILHRLITCCSCNHKSHLAIVGYTSNSSNFAIRRWLSQMTPNNKWNLKIYFNSRIWLNSLCTIILSQIIESILQSTECKMSSHKLIIRLMHEKTLVILLVWLTRMINGMRIQFNVKQKNLTK